MTFDASFNRSGYWWPDFAWTDDVRTMDLTTTQTRGAFLELRRDPVRWGYNGTWSWFTHHRLDEPRNQVRRARLQQHKLRRNLRLSQPADLPVSQPAGRDQLLPASRFGAGLRYPNNTNAGVMYHSWFANDSINLTPKLTVNAGVRFDHYSSWLPEQGNPGTGPFATARVYPGDARLPGLQRVVAAPVGRLRHHGHRTRRAQGQLRPLCGVRLRRDRTRQVRSPAP